MFTGRGVISRVRVRVSELTLRSGFSSGAVFFRSTSAVGSGLRRVLRSAGVATRSVFWVCLRGVRWLLRWVGGVR